MGRDGQSLPFHAAIAEVGHFAFCLRSVYSEYPVSTTCIIILWIDDIFMTKLCHVRVYGEQRAFYLNSFGGIRGSPHQLNLQPLFLVASSKLPSHFK